MDSLGDWELLSDDGLFDFYGDTHRSVNPNSRSKRVYQFEDYFSPESSVIAGSSIETRIVPVPIQFNPVIGNDDEEVTKLPIESSVVPSENKATRGLPEAGGDEDAAKTQVFFVKMKETDQFVDMKMDSPKSGSKGMILPQIDAGAYQFEDQNDAVSEEGKTGKTEIEAVDAKEAVGWEEESGGVNIWKWSLTGIGALCSFGVAAATVCIIILGSHHKNQQQQQSHKARFQIYASDKRMTQVVHQATRLNEVIAGTRGGIQLGRAHISYGGYYDSV